MKYDAESLCDYAINGFPYLPLKLSAGSVQRDLHENNQLVPTVPVRVKWEYKQDLYVLRDKQQPEEEVYPVLVRKVSTASFSVTEVF